MDVNVDSLIQELVDILEKHQKGIVSKESLLEHIHALAVFVALESRSDEEKNVIKKKTQDNQSSEMLENVLLEYISAEHYMVIFNKTALHVIEYYVTNMIPTVPEDVQAELKSYLSKITST